MIYTYIVYKVNNKVLIPRPDTEIIIEEVLRITKNKLNLKVLDIGVGSGCIILSILKEKKDFYGIGIDVSQNCIDLSKKNTLNLGLKNKVKFFKTDVDNFNHGKYDLIISNPPYINKIDLKYLDRDVVNFEPKIALTSVVKVLVIDCTDIGLSPPTFISPTLITFVFLLLISLNGLMLIFTCLV